MLAEQRASDFSVFDFWKSREISVCRVETLEKIYLTQEQRYQQLDFISCFLKRKKREKQNKYLSVKWILFSKHYLKVWDLWNEIDKIFVQAWNWQQTDKVDEDFDAKKYKSEQISLHYGLNEWIT